MRLRSMVIPLILNSSGILTAVQLVLIKEDKVVFLICWVLLPKMEVGAWLYPMLLARLNKVLNTEYLTIRMEMDFLIIGKKIF